MTFEVLEQRIQHVETALEQVHERNRKVAIEKAWETSRTRIFSLIILTYALMCLIFYMLGVQQLFQNAIIPTMGYFLSTQSLPLIKRVWIRYQDTSTHKQN